jgi:hypothetical protein
MKKLVLRKVVLSDLDETTSVQGNDIGKTGDSGTLGTCSCFVRTCQPPPPSYYC